MVFLETMMNGRVEVYKEDIEVLLGMLAAKEGFTGTGETATALVSRSFVARLRGNTLVGKVSISNVFDNPTSIGHTQAGSKDYCHRSVVGGSGGVHSPLMKRYPAIDNVREM